MAVTRLARWATQQRAITVQVAPGSSDDEESFDWWPKADHVAILGVRYEPGVAIAGPPGWTQAAHEPRVLAQGQEVAAALWWFRLSHDYDGWRYGMEPTPGIDQFELPAVLFSRPCQVDLEFQVFSDVPSPLLVDTGTAMGLLFP